MSATTALTATSGGFDILSGIFGMTAADAKAESLRQQAQLVQSESEADIARYSSEARGFKSAQKLAYLKSGVDISGSPLDILDETARVATENINAIRAKGAATAQALRGESANVSASGRLAFLKGLGNAAITAVQTGSRLGWFGGKKDEVDVTGFGNTYSGGITNPLFIGSKYGKNP